VSESLPAAVTDDIERETKAGHPVQRKLFHTFLRGDFPDGNGFRPFCATNGTPIHLCSLDAEIAFDAIPHAILIMKAANLIPDPYWRVLLAW
jgi:hypothetical protein